MEGVAMQWIRTWPGADGSYRAYFDLEKFNQIYVDVVAGSSPAVWVIYGSHPTLGAIRLGLGEWSDHSDANDALEQLVESL